MVTHGPEHWPHQLEALRFIHAHRGSLLWIPMRAGKSRVAVDYVQNTDFGPTLIVCPHKVIPVWEEQFRRYAPSIPGARIQALGTGTVAERAQSLACSSFPNVITIMNYDIIAEDAMAKQLLKIPWGTIFFDEVHRLQAPGGKQSRFAARLAKNAKKIIGLSGTPGNPLGSPKKQAMRDAGILDLYGVMRTLSPGTFGYNYNQYKALFGIWNQFTPFPKIEGYQNHAEFDRRLAQVCYQVSETDLCYTMPEAIPQVRPVVLPEAVQMAYTTLENELTTGWGDESVTVSNALVKQLRLQQMTAGFLQLDNGAPAQLVHTVKVDAIKEIIDDIEAHERVLVFCQFKPEMDLLTEELKTTERKIFHIRGGTDTSDQWKATPGTILIVQIQAGGEGLDLSMTNYCIYSSLCHSLRAYSQSFKRPQKADKKHPIAYYYIVATGTIDEDIQAALDAGEEVVDSVRTRLSTRRSENHVS